jgi:hypothetical protein
MARERFPVLYNAHAVNPKIYTSNDNAQNFKLFHSGTMIIINYIKIGQRGLSTGWSDSGYEKDESQN